MKKIIFSALFSVILLLTSVFCNAQAETKKNPTDNIFYGGGVGLNISNNYWGVNVAPMLGYRFTQALSAGVSALVGYDNYHGYTPAYSLESYGGGVFTRFDFGSSLMQGMPFSIFVQADYEGVQQDIKFKDSAYKNYSEFQNRLFLGAGYMQPIGARSRAYVMVSIDVLNTNGKDGVVPVIRAGIEL